MYRPAVFSALLSLAVMTNAQTQPAPSANPSRESAIRIIEQIKRADYEGDRPALKRLHDELTPAPDNKLLASRELYWRGFALWRRAINGFNETPTPQDLEEDLNGAITDFNDSLADSTFVESKIAEGSCYGYLAYLNLKDQPRMQEMIQHSSPLLKEAMAADPDNPRLLWVLGPIRWSSPPERGGGQDKAFDLYNRGLEIIAKVRRNRSTATVLGRTRVTHEPRLVAPPQHHSRPESRAVRRNRGLGHGSLLALRPRHPHAPNSRSPDQVTLSTARVPHPSFAFFAKEGGDFDFYLGGSILDLRDELQSLDMPVPSNPASFQSSIAPWLSVPDGPKAINFYKSAFEATEVYRLDDPGGGLVVRLSVNGAEFWVSQDSISQDSVSQESVSQESPEHRQPSPHPVGGGSIRMILTVANPDAVFARSLEAGATEVFPVGEGHGWRRDASSIRSAYTGKSATRSRHKLPRRTASPIASVPRIVNGL